ncbi:MAG: hypothetical protein HKM96_07780 [Boseongicola sp.]|nr:hypothetical protein [Silicimonas sp.]NNF91269.1 hypothetical protein [Boseongicola sp.]
MFAHDKDALETKSRVYRYFFYLLSSFRPVPMSQWVEEGEPNPFVTETRRVRITHQAEIQDIFHKSLGRR